nr:DUF4131 domain-containing protein [Lachnospiraceae bacterium]
MRKRPVLICSFALLFGEVFAIKGHILPLVFLFLIICLSLYKRKKSKAILLTAIILLSFFTGLFRLHFAITSINETRDYLATKGKINFRGRVSSKQQKNNQISYTLTSVTLNGSRRIRESIYIYVDSDIVSQDSIIEGYGRVKKLHRAENDGGFDEASYLASLNIAGKIEGEDIKLLSAPKIPWKEYLNLLSRSFFGFYESSLPKEEAWIVEAMCLGDKSMLTEEVKDLFSSAGL